MGLVPYSSSNDPNMERLFTSTALIIIEDNVVKTYTNPDVEYDDKAVEENLQAIKDNMDDRKVFNLFIPDPSTHITVEAREFQDNRFERAKLAEALVIRTLGHRILANFYVKARKRKYPVRIFDSEQEALEWFESVKEEVLAD